MPIRIIILDDHHLFRQGIRSVLANALDIEIVGEGGSGEEFTRLVIAHKPNVILLDLGMPQHPGDSVRTPGNSFQAIEAIDWLKASFPAIQVLVISQYIDPGIVEAAAEAGVAGYILKDDQLSRFLPEAIRAIHQGGVYFSEAVSRGLSETHRARPYDLSPRHVEILRFIAAHPNQTQAEHAKALGISIHTLHNHCKTIFQCLGVNNLIAAVVFAIESGIAVPGNFHRPAISREMTN